MRKKKKTFVSFLYSLFYTIKFQHDDNVKAMFYRYCFCYVLTVYDEVLLIKSEEFLNILIL